MNEEWKRKEQKTKNKKQKMRNKKQETRNKRTLFVRHKEKELHHKVTRRSTKEGKNV
jgi:hypothetical protein